MTTLRMGLLLLLLLAGAAAQDGLTASASLSLVRPCARDSDCSLTLACLEGGCRSPCTAACPMEGGLCKVVGHRPVCSCPAGTHNINSTCTSDTSCSFGQARYSNGQVRYDGSCTNRCECYSSQWICQATACEPGFRQKGLLSTDTDPQCRERSHPGGDECCVLWVCAEEETMEEEEEAPRAEKGSEENLRLLQITATSIQVQFPDITGGNLMYVESLLLDRRDPPWENAILVEGNKIFTLTGLTAATRYTLRWKAPGRQYPDLQVSTGPSRRGQKPKVIMTAHTFDSAQLSFDQFRPPGYTAGYVVSWRAAGGDGAWRTAEQRPTGDTPTVRLEGLTPGTQYEAKISIYEDPTNQVLGRSTELILFSTEPGCVHEGTARPLGLFFVGCESACECEETGRVSCDERCQAPLHRQGATIGRPLCAERQVDESHCCVLVTCQDESASGPCQDTQCGPHAECRHELGGQQGTICVCREGHTGDPDSRQGCGRAPDPAITATISEAPACRAQNRSYSPGQTWYDGCEYSCSCSPKLEIACEPRCKLITENVASQCELKPDPEDTCCQTMVCPPATNNTNILQPSLPFDGCVFKGATYQKEERFFDGCEQQCQCMGWGDLVCLARCPPTTPGLGEDCYTLPDVTDACCNFTVCDKPTLEVPDVERVAGPLETLAGRAKQPRVLEGGQGVTEGVLLGEFTEHHHGVRGQLWAVNESTLVIRNFSYDGEAPDVFFYAGSSSRPMAEGASILPFPWRGVAGGWDPAEEGPPLGAFRDSTVLLRLPTDLPVARLRWLAVWCRAFNMNFGDVVLEAAASLEERTGLEETPRSSSCLHSGRQRAVGEEWYDGCSAYCVCSEGGQPTCLDIQCPHEFGLDVIQPNCIDWDRHEDFVPAAPTCCPPVPSCRSDGSCAYRGANFSNYDTIPMELSGCEDRCYCENTEVQCKSACYELAESAPSWLQCEAGCAATLPREDRPCCLEWRCAAPEDCPEAPQKPIDVPRSLPWSNATAYNASCIAVTFGIPAAIAGHRGHYTVAYSSGFGGPADPANWPEVEFPQEGGAIPDTGLIFLGEEVVGRALLCRLQPGLQYLLRASVVLELGDGIQLRSSGDIISAKIDISIPQPPQPEPQVVVYLDMEVVASALSPVSARLDWRHLEETEEKPFVDGVQLRIFMLGEEGIPKSHVPQTSPFIHRDTNYHVLQDLQPDTRYEVDLDLIPVQGAAKELYSGRKVEFRTPPEVDVYNFVPALTVLGTGQDSVEVGWTGVPSPDQKFVNIYRVIYHTVSENSVRDESSVFKISKLDSPKRIFVSALRSDQPYQIWLQAYLTNGKTVQSNVEEFRTKPAPPSAQPVEGAGEARGETSYYSSMVAAAIVATFALMGLAVVLYFYLRRHTTYKATITKERPASKASTAYDNSAFKDFDPSSSPAQVTGGQSFELGRYPDSENNSVAGKHSA